MVDHRPPLIQNEKSYANWKKAIKLWSIATSIPKSKQAIVVALSLQDEARESALEIEESVLLGENGIRELLKKLDLTFKEFKADSYYAFIDFDSCVRVASETMAAYITRFENRHSRLEMFQTSISDDILGLKLLAGARLTACELQEILDNDNTEWSMSAISRILCDMPNYSNVFSIWPPESRSVRPAGRRNGSRIFQSKPKTEVAQFSKFTFSKPSIGKFGLTSTGTTVRPITTAKVTSQQPAKTTNTTVTQETKFSTSDVTIPKFFFTFPKTSAAAVNLAAKIANSPASAVDILRKSTNTTVTQEATKSSTKDVTIPKFSFSFPKTSAAAVNLAAKIAGSPQKVISTADQGTKPEGLTNDDDQNKDIHRKSEDSPHFEPIVKLPDKVQTKTGEENQKVLYYHRVKLYRYIGKQWKKIGVGEMKILHNVSTKRSKIVMRKYQVVELCADHYIIPEMKLSHLRNSKKIWTWTTVDHSDPNVESKAEVLAVQFKTAEEASDFKKAIDQAKDILQGKDVSPLTTTITSIKSSTQNIATACSYKLSTICTSTSQTMSQNIAQTQVSSTKEMLVVDKNAGFWNCSGCYAQNEPSDSKCLCCDVPKPSAPKVEEIKGSASTFTFGTSSKPTVFSFKASRPIFGNQQPVQSSAPLSFGFTQQQQTSNLFSNLSSTTPKSTPLTTGRLPTPRFPSVGDEEDSDEDEDYTDAPSEVYN